MNSTITEKNRQGKRKAQPGKRPVSPVRSSEKSRSEKNRAPGGSAAKRSAVKGVGVKKNEPAPGIADWIGLGPAGEAGVLPEWKDLSTGKKNLKNARNVSRQVDSFLSEVTTSRFALFLTAAAFGLGLYVSHVFATRDTLSILEQQRRENLRLELQFNQLKGQLDKKISPNVIYRRARELGLKEGVAFGPTIQWQLEEE